MESKCGGRRSALMLLLLGTRERRRKARWANHTSANKSLCGAARGNEPARVWGSCWAPETLTPLSSSASLIECWTPSALSRASCTVVRSVAKAAVSRGSRRAERERGGRTNGEETKAVAASAWRGQGKGLQSIEHRCAKQIAATGSGILKARSPGVTFRVSVTGAESNAEIGSFS